MAGVVASRTFFFVRSMHTHACTRLMGPARRVYPMTVGVTKISFSSVSTARAFGQQQDEGRSVEAAKRMLRKAQAVAFDVDSTVCLEEGIDVLADYLGQGKAVAELTAKAMGGSVLFQDALKARLDLIRPSRPKILELLREHPPRLSPGVQEFVAALHQRGTVVYLVSGGFRIMIEPVADLLKVPHNRIYANRLLFHEGDGSYVDFDPQEPTSRDGGKPAVIRSLKERFGYHTVVMVGDGVTDMQAKPPADAFIGYGGVAVREKVLKGADWFVRDFAQLLEVIRSPTDAPQP